MKHLPRCRLCKRTLSEDRKPRTRDTCPWHIHCPKGKRRPKPLAGGRPR